VMRDTRGRARRIIAILVALAFSGARAAADASVAMQGFTAGGDCAESPGRARAAKPPPR
jgi:hypothetical protein